MKFWSLDHIRCLGLLIIPDIVSKKRKKNQLNKLKSIDHSRCLGLLISADIVSKENQLTLAEK